MGHRRATVPMVLLLAAVTAAGCGGSSSAARSATAEEPARDGPPPEMLPRFTPDGELVRPAGWEGWVLAGTSMGLTYDEPSNLPAAGEPPGRFLNVYMQPWVYERFQETAEFPEGTMFILAGADPVRKTDPARGGFYQGEVSLLEVHVKKEGLHESGWGFYGFGGGDAETAPMIPGEASCYSCHRDNTAHDNVFVQFYPSLRRRIASAAGAGSGTEPGAGAPGGER